MRHLRQSNRSAEGPLLSNPRTRVPSHSASQASNSPPEHHTLWQAKTKKYINAHLPDTYYFIYESIIKVYSCAFTGTPIRLNLLVLWDGTVYKTMLCNINKLSESCTSVTSLVPFGSLRLTAMLCRKDHECRIYGFTVFWVTNNCTGRYILFTTFLFLLTLRK